MSQLVKSKIIIAAVVGVSIIVAEVILWKFLKRKNKNRQPKKWKKVGEVSDLLCYPIKSCGWIRIDKFDCTKLGIQSNNIRDRTFMVVQSDGEFVTARKHPKFVQVMPRFQEDLVTLSAPGMPEIQFNIEELAFKDSSQAVVWGQSVEVKDAGEAIAQWFSRFILEEDAGLRLVYYPSTFPTRDVREKNKNFDTAKREDTGALHDATSFMLINERSVDELNTRIVKKVTPLQFRPNIVMKGPDAFEEDKWNWIKIGEEVVFQNVKPCTRCIFTNIDPETAERGVGEEPLKTLKLYRQFAKTGESPVMGIHLGTRQEGEIKVGDAIYVESE